MVGRQYRIEIKAKAVKDIGKFLPDDRDRIINAIDKMGNNLAGDVKHLINFIPGYRLRVGGYRVLFDIEGDALVVYRVKKRKDAYR